MKNQVPNYKYLNCPALGYFECICGLANSLGHNAYFSSHCVFEECTNSDNRRGDMSYVFLLSLGGHEANKVMVAFVAMYKRGCEARKLELIDIPTEWVPFAQEAPLPPPPGSSEAAQSSTTLPTLLTLRMTTALRAATPTLAVQLTYKNSLEPSSPLNMGTPTQSVGPSESYGPDLQFPICAVRSSSRNPITTPN